MCSCPRVFTNIKHAIVHARIFLKCSWAYKHASVLGPLCVHEHKSICVLCPYNVHEPSTVQEIIHRSLISTSIQVQHRSYSLWQTHPLSSSSRGTWDPAHIALETQRTSSPQRDRSPLWGARRSNPAWRYPSGRRTGRYGPSRTRRCTWCPLGRWRGTWAMQGTKILLDGKSGDEI